MGVLVDASSASTSEEQHPPQQQQQQLQGPSDEVGDEPGDDGTSTVPRPAAAEGGCGGLSPKGSTRGSHAIQANLGGPLSRGSRSAGGGAPQGAALKGEVPLPLTQSSEVYLNLEVARTHTVKATLLLSYLALMLALGSLVALFVVKVIKDEEYFVLNLWLYKWTLGHACACMVALLIASCWWLHRHRAVRRHGYTWSPAHARVSWLQSARMGVQLVALVFIIVPNAYIISTGTCFPFTDGTETIVWSAFWQWLSYSTILFLLVYEARDTVLGHKHAVVVQHSQPLPQPLLQQPCVGSANRDDSVAGGDDPVPAAASAGEGAKGSRGGSDVEAGTANGLVDDLAAAWPPSITEGVRTRGPWGGLLATQKLVLRHLPHLLLWGASLGVLIGFLQHVFEDGGIAGVVARFRQFETSFIGFIDSWAVAADWMTEDDEVFVPDDLNSTERAHLVKSFGPLCGYFVGVVGLTWAACGNNTGDLEMELQLQGWPLNDTGIWGNATMEQQAVTLNKACGADLSLQQWTAFWNGRLEEVDWAQTNWKEQLNYCSLSTEVKALSIAYSIVLVMFSVLYIGYTFYNFSVLMRLPYQKYRLENLLLRYQLRMTLVALNVLMLSFLLNWYVDFGKCGSLLCTLTGMIPVDLVFTSLTVSGAVLLAPSLKQLQELHKFTWTPMPLSPVAAVRAPPIKPAALPPGSELAASSSSLQTAASPSVKAGCGAAYSATNATAEAAADAVSTNSDGAVRRGSEAATLDAAYSATNAAPEAATGIKDLSVEVAYGATYSATNTAAQAAAEAASGSAQGDDFCFDTALRCCYWSTYVYRGDDDVLYNGRTACGLFGLRRAQEYVDESRDVRAVMGAGRRCALLAFRGTISQQNIWHDLKIWRTVHLGAARGSAWRKPKVHVGFLYCWNKSSVRGDIMRDLSAALGEYERSQAGSECGGAGPGPGSAPSPFIIVITGHSLGGAIAMLAAHEIQRLYGSRVRCRVYTFGVPRVGNYAFASDYNALLPDTWNVVNDSDIVTRGGKFLFMFKRPGRRVKVNRWGDMVVSPTFLENNVLQRPAGSLADHLLAGYRAALGGVMEAQFSSKAFDGGAAGVSALFSDPSLRPLLERVYGVHLVLQRGQGQQQRSKLERDYSAPAPGGGGRRDGRPPTPGSGTAYWRYLVGMFLLQALLWWQVA